MTASAPSKIGTRSASTTSASTQVVFEGVQAGRRRAMPTIRSISGSSPSARTTDVPTFPVAPVTTTLIEVQVPPRPPAPNAGEARSGSWKSALRGAQVETLDDGPLAVGALGELLEVDLAVAAAESVRERFPHLPLAGDADRQG